MSEKFKFQNLDAEMGDGRGIVRDGDFYAINNGKFYQVAPASYDVAEHITGWKFHISVAPQDVPRTWDLLQEKFEAQSLAAKVTNPELIERFGQENDPQRGKMITVYEDNFHNRDMEGFLKDVERTLRENGIEPGHDVNDDRKMNGSSYIHYRNDRNLEGAYLSADTTGGYNPAGHEDPFKNIDLNNLERSPTEKLAIAEGGMVARYGTTPQWGNHQGHAFTRVRDRYQADEMSRVFNQFGIPARQVQEGVVAIPEEALASIPDEAFEKANKLSTALAMQETLQSHHSQHITAAKWQAHTGSSSVPDPHLRAYFADEDYARKMADHMAHQTGVPASYAYKDVDGQRQHMVVVGMDNPEHVQRNVGIMREQQQAPQMQQPEQEATQVYAR